MVTPPFFFHIIQYSQHDRNKKRRQRSGFQNFLDGRHCFKEMTKLCLNTRTENMVKKMGSIQPWCFWELHVERPWKPESPMCHRRTPTCTCLRPQCLLYCTQPLWCPAVTYPTPRNVEVWGVFHVCFALRILSPIIKKKIPENGVITSYKLINLSTTYFAGCTLANGRLNLRTITQL